MRRSWTCLLLGLACTHAVAAPFVSRLAEGQKLLKKGNPDAAIALFRDLQVERPNSPELLFSLGMAQFEQAASKEIAEEAIPGFEEARKSFELARSSGRKDLRRDANFNAANSLAKIALTQLGQQSGGDDLEKSFEAAIGAYEDHLRQYPDDLRAQTNLNHLRYQLKKALQNPPPPQDQQEGGSGEADDKKKDQGDQSQSQNGSGENQDSEQQQKPDDEQTPESPKEGANQTPDSENLEEKPDPFKDGAPPEMAEAGESERDAKSQAELKPGEVEEDAEQEKMARQNIEAILQNLEAQDNQMQRDNLRSRSRIQFPKEWW